VLLLQSLTSHGWRLEEGSWSVIGNLKKGVTGSSAAFIGDSIYVIVGFGPNTDEYPFQRVDLDGEEIKNVEIIDEIIRFGNHNNGKSWPVLFHTTFDYCVNN